MGVKLSVSLSDVDVETVDRFAAQSGLGSRSAVIQLAVRRLADDRLDDGYAEAWREWEETGDAADWETTAGDGLS